MPRLDKRTRAVIGPRNLKVKGSPEWCWQTLDLLKSCYRYVEEEWQVVERMRTELAEVKAWEVIPPGNPYGSEEAMLLAEIGESATQVTQTTNSARDRAMLLMKTVPEAPSPEETLAKRVEGGKKAGKGRPSIGALSDKAPIDGGKSKYGTSAYFVARIKRDHRDIADQLEAGAFSSIKAAARAAGIIKVKTPLEHLNHWWDKASDEEKRAFIQEHRSYGASND